MKKPNLLISTTLLAALAGAAPASLFACSLHDDMTTIQNGFGEFHLPLVGDIAANVMKNYGAPMRRLGGPNGLDIWDYGSFRVIMNKQRVTFAGMW